MALSRSQKTTQLTELKDKMKKSQSIMFAHYIGLNVAAVSKLRGKLKESKAEMKVAKKSLMQLAAKELQLPEISDETLNGPVACIFSFDDALAGAQVAFTFSKENPQVKLIGGIYDGKIVSAEEAVALAKIPSKLQLLGIFASMLNTPLRSFAIGLSEIAKKKAEPAAPAPAAAPEAPAAPAAEAAAPAPEAASTPAPEAPAPAAAPEAAAPAADAPAA